MHTSIKKKKKKKKNMSLYLYAIKQSNNSFKNYFLIFKLYFWSNLYL